MRSSSALLTGLVLLVSMAWAQEEHHHHALTEEEVGSVQFETSCAKDVTASFNRAVALLHSFQYEQTRQAFAEIAKEDPKCAMAQWGIAMSHYHGLWDNGDMAAGRAALRQAQQIAASNSATTTREKGLHRRARRDLRGRRQGQGRPRTGFRAENGSACNPLTPATTKRRFSTRSRWRSPRPRPTRPLPTSASAERFWNLCFAKHPNHPGIAHYMIHCYDNPVLAEQGLSAARLYAKIAPASAHANHMPSHIFTRVGLWDESIASNLRSAELATKDEAASANGEARDQRLHAMDYLEYAYLQSGRVSQAKAVLDEMNSLKPIPGLTLTGGYANAAIPARYALERGDWESSQHAATGERHCPLGAGPHMDGDWSGQRARVGSWIAPREAEHRLATLRDSAACQVIYWSNQIEVQRREVAAWIAEMNGKAAGRNRDDALGCGIGRKHGQTCGHARSHRSGAGDAGGIVASASSRRGFAG